MAEDSLISYYESLAEEIASEAVDIIKRLLELSGTKRLSTPAISPFEVWANATKLLEDDDQVAGYAAQFGAEGVFKLWQMKEDAARKRGLFMPQESAPEVEGGTNATTA